MVWIFSSHIKSYSINIYPHQAAHLMFPSLYFLNGSEVFIKKTDFRPSHFWAVLKVHLTCETLQKSSSPRGVVLMPVLSLELLAIQWDRRYFPGRQHLLYCTHATLPLYIFSHLLFPKVLYIFKNHLFLTLHLSHFHRVKGLFVHPKHKSDLLI